MKRIDKRQHHDQQRCFQVRGLLFEEADLGGFFLATVFLLVADFLVLDLLALVGFLAVVIGGTC